MQCDICCEEKDKGSMKGGKSEPLWICLECEKINDKEKQNVSRK